MVKEGPISIDKRTGGQKYLQNLHEGSSAGSLDAFLLTTTLLWEVRKAEIVTRLGQLIPSDTGDLLRNRRWPNSRYNEYVVENVLFGDRCTERYAVRPHS
jgi:hypothetical protein